MCVPYTHTHTHTHTRTHTHTHTHTHTLYICNTQDKAAKSYDRLYDESQCTRAGEIEVDSDGEPDFM